MMPRLVSFLANAPAGCVHSFLGLKPWYQYLNLHPWPDCSLNLDLTQSSNWNQLWLIGLALLDDLLYVGGVVAVVFVIYGGFRYLTSQGNPENIKAAGSTILNAIVGLIIAFIAAGAVSYIGNKLGGTSTVNGLPNVVADGNTVSTVLDIVFMLMGGIAVIMVIFGGFKYVTSGGDPQATARAKDTILYALIGMAVAIFATVILNFILYELSQ
ncbi:MAG TPA: pilin [Bacteroidia bacterium]|jgi:hypothetical protein|nr:pilin [Bacteroidia bacterium]